MSASPSSQTDPLDLTSLDSDSLFAALGAVDRAIPDLLLSVKPVLAHLTSPTPDRTSQSANDAIETYMSTLDKIQFVLRQTVYYLRETKASTSALRPPAVGAIPTPFAASLPSRAGVKGMAGVEGGDEGPIRGNVGSERRGDSVELGLYGMRAEVRVMKDLEATLRKLRETMDDDGGGEMEMAQDGEDQSGRRPQKENI